jgi:hypothetical protein
MVRTRRVALLISAAGCASEPDLFDARPDVEATDGWDRPEPAAAGVPGGHDGPASDGRPVFDGAFTDLSAPLHLPAPLGADPGDPALGRAPSSVVLFVADLDGDDSLEVVEGDEASRSLDPSTRVVRVYRWTVDGLTPAPELAAAIPPALDLPYAALDLDGDGLVDLLSSGLGVGVAWGRAPGAWEPWTPLVRGTPRVSWMSPAFDDLDDDGWLDLWMWDGACESPPVPLLRVGRRAFFSFPSLVGGDVEPSLLAAILPIHRDDGTSDLLAVATTGCGRVPELFARAERGADGLPRYRRWDAVGMDAWWKLLPRSAGQPISAMMPMGATQVDVDLDGLQDVIVTLGVARQGLLRGLPGGDFDADGFDPSFQTALADDGSAMFPWAVVTPDLDLDGRPDVVWTVGDDATSFLGARGVPMAMGALWNAGGGRFLDVAPDVGFVPLGSWHALAAVDVDLDGDADLAAGAFGAPSRAWRNDLHVAGRRGLSLRLRGTTSNALALGAVVEVEADGLPTRRIVVGVPGNPRGTTEPWLFVGLGEAPAVTLRIRWPSGWTQVVRDVGPGSRTFVEPPTIEVVGGRRQLPADGATRTTIRVVPRDAEGGARLDAAVSVAALDARLDVSGPILRADSLEFEVRSPAAATTSRLEVRVDGLPIEVRPRLWWD